MIQLERVVDRVTIMSPSKLMRALLVAFVVGAGMLAAQTPDYDARRAGEVRRCESIDPSAYQSGLFMNPDGYRSYYERSRCLQETAVRYRDASLCRDVKQRRTMLSSSWGYSASRCRSLVKEGIAADGAALEDIARRYRAGHVVLRDFRIELNGNGRDFDLLPVFAGGPGGRYRLTVDVAPAAVKAAPAIIHDNGYFVDGGGSSLNIFVRRDDVVRAVPGWTPDRRYVFRVTLLLSLPAGDRDGVWSDAFVQRVFPSRDRSQSLTRELAFPVRTR